MAAFLRLPNETIIEILTNVSSEYHTAVQLVCRRLRDVYVQATVLQYWTALIEAGLRDNPLNLLTAQDKLAILKKEEESWAFLEPDLRTKASTNFRSGGLYDLTADHYLLSDGPKKTLHYLRLPRTELDTLEWRGLAVDQPIVDLALCIYEHDLAAIVTRSIKEDGRYFAISLLQFSTGNSHPDALTPEIIVPNSIAAGRPALAMEIIGDHLILLMFFHSQTPSEQVIHIYDWRTGVVKARWTAPPSSYHSLVFLTHNLFLLPNQLTNSLEIYSIPESITLEPLKPVSLLALPELNNSFRVSSITCRAEPNPFHTQNARRDGGRPFYHDSQQAIILFNYYTHGVDPRYMGQPMPFSIFVHRQSILDIALEDILRASSKELSPPKPHHWSEWGPRATRWIDASAIGSNWITTTAGERAVMMTLEYSQQATSPYIVLDFNPKRVEKMKNWIQRVEASLEAEPPIESNSYGVEQAKRARKEKTLHRFWTVEEEEEAIQPSRRSQSIFKEPIVSALPYFASVSKEENAWSGVLLDEERVVGLEGGTRIRTVNIHHFG